MRGLFGSGYPTKSESGNAPAAVENPEAIRGFLLGDVCERAESALEILGQVGADLGESAVHSSPQSSIQRRKVKSPSFLRV